MTEKLRVCFLIAGFGEGGAQKQCIYLLNELRSRADADIHLIYFYEGVNFSFLNVDGISLWRLPEGSFYNPRNILRIMRVVRQVCPDVIFSWLQSSDVYAYFVRFFCGRKLRWVLAERDSAYPDDWRFRLRRSLGLKADLIIANSKKGVTYWLENGAPEGRVSYVPNIVAVDGKGGCSGRSVGTRKRVIFAGRMERQKNVLAIAEAFCRLSLEYTDVDFMLIGNGGLVEEVRSVVNDCKNVIQLPFQKNIIDFYKEALVFVNVSLHEGMPNTVMENIALGNRVVVSKIDEHVALLGPGYKYYVSDLCCVDEIAQIVRDALQSHRVEDDYVFAKSVMAGMTGVGVSSKYMELFRQLALK